MSTDATQATISFSVVHTLWSGGALRIWAEDAEGLARPGAAAGGHADTHPFAASREDLRALSGEVLREPDAPIEELELLLPAGAGAGVPLPSPALAHAAGLEPGAFEQGPELGRFRVPTLVLRPDQVARAFDALMDRFDAPAGASFEGMELGEGESVRFHAAVLALARHVMAKQRFVPMLTQRSSGAIHGGWMPWVSDEATAQEVSRLVRAMPPAARAAVDEFSHQPWAGIADMLTRVVDAEVRRILIADNMIETVEDRDASDPQVAWLQGLLGARDEIEASSAMRQEMIRRVRGWVGGLEERGASAEWRLCLRLNEPIESLLDDNAEPGTQAPTVNWSVSFHLQAVDTPELLVDAPDIWALPSDEVTIGGHRLEHPQELLLGELGRAARFFSRLEEALSEAEPIELQLSTEEAYRFLRELRPVLTEQGIGVQTPTWWDTPESRLGARLRIDSGPAENGEEERGIDAAGRAAPQLGLSTLVDYHWEIAVGDTTLSLKEFEQIAQKGSPLVRIGGRWVEVRPEDVDSAIRFIRENPGGKMNLGEAMGLAFGADARETGLPVIGIEAEGWLGAVLSEDGAREALPTLEQPRTFKGTLRPYQIRGLSWMAFMERFGLGVCLADDMGLGKTIQLLALLQHERERAPEGAEPLGPTLLIAPTSVLGNWRHEAERFAPELEVMVHHGPERLTGRAFVDGAMQQDLVVTTYALAHRDRELLEAVKWRRAVLDEAQCIKNPSAKQSQAARSVPTDRRIALTGTPVENRLSELWSVMDFLNPGYLSDPTTFRKRFSIPIERYHDEGRSQRLRQMVRPFVLRRLKTDPSVVSDLPEKLETREYCHLTGEQASLYENCVQRMLSEVERAEGIQRRGLVLSALIRLKQICNHPSQLLKDADPAAGRPPAINRSGKAIRLAEQLEEVLAEGEQALIFTQFRQMGHLLSTMLRHHFDSDVLFLHGGTPQKQRQAIIDAFQRRDGTHPLLILSLKAGGVGLNLTAATHVFHYDRWWNPAVENQATDRAYRIGQTRTVVVHKYLVRGTLEERIDQMIEQKTELAENIIGSGERWLTDLSTDDLRSILSLRSDAIGEDGEG